MSLKNLLKKQKQLAKQLNALGNTRNIVALNPLLKKGGVHDKDNPKTYHKSTRKQQKLMLKKEQWE
ncbi:MAG: hypothetical protein Q4G13_03595 [Moraxella sp.]|nr:hypothetical protein [Moraxella sp.]